MKEERTKKKSEGISEVLSWANKMRRLEEKRNTQKEKALQLSKILEEQVDLCFDVSFNRLRHVFNFRSWIINSSLSKFQDNIGQGESEDEEATLHATSMF